MKETEMIDYKKRKQRVKIIAELIAIEKDNGYLPDHLLREYLQLRFPNVRAKFKTYKAKIG